MGCKRCWPESAEAAWEARRTLTRDRELIDESHFHVMILSCDACGQRFLSVFTEKIDWSEGDDPQAWTVLPLTREESDRLIERRERGEESTVEALGRGRRSLRYDCPKDAPRRAWWSEGLTIGPHD